MVNFYDSEKVEEGAEYVVECVSDRDGRTTTHLPIHSRAGLTFEEAKSFQISREKQGYNAVIRRW